MKFGRHATALLICSMMFSSITITIISNKIFSGMTTAVEEGQLQLMKSIVNASLQSAESKTVGRAELIAQMPAVQTLFAAHDRTGLMTELQHVFAMQKEKYGVDQAQFHLPPGISFLRLHKPELFGDDQTSFRPMVVAVNREHVHKSGFTIGRTGPGLFGIVPVFDANHNFIGSFEIGIDFPNVFDSLKLAYGLDISVFIQEDPLKETATSMPAGVLSDQNRLGQYIRYYSSNAALVKALVHDSDLNGSEGNHYVREALGVYYGVQVVPLINASGKTLGRIVVAKDFSDSRSAQNRAIVWQILMALFAIVSMSGLILITVRGALLRPLQVLTTHFSHLAGGDACPDTPLPDKLCKELEALAHQYDRLRKAKVRLQK